MIRLLNAGFTRLRKNKLILCLCIFTIGIALCMIYTRYSDMKNYHDIIEVEQIILNYSTVIGIVIAIFTSLFLGVEYSDGTIRNKISIGHKRINIYLSNLIITTFTSLSSYALFIVIVCSIGVPLFGSISIPLFSLFSLLGCIFMAVIAYCSIFTFIAMMISNKTMIAITSIVLAFIMMVYSLMAYDSLQQPEYMDQMIIKPDTEERVMESTKNPRYLTGTKKMLVQLSLDINPTGQVFQITGRTVSNVKVLSLYSLGVIVIFTSAGLALFKKKELK